MAVPFEKSPDGSIRAFVAGQWVQLQGPSKPQGAFGEPKEEPQNQGQGAFGEYIGRPLQRGLGTLQSAGGALAGELGIVSPETEAGQIVAGQQRIAANPPSPEYKAQQDKVFNAPTFLGSLGELVRNPSVVPGLMAESAAPSLPSFVGGAVGAFGGPAGLAAGVGIGSAATEFGSSLVETLDREGVDVNNTDAVTRALADQQIMGKARERAIRRGIPVGIFDALSGRLAGSLLRGASGVGSTIARGAGELGIQAGAGGAGEATAQAATGEYQPGQIVAEMAGEVPGGVGEIITGAYGARRGSASGENPPQADPVDNGEQPTPQPNGPPPSGGTPPVPQARPRGAFDDIGAQAQASVAPLEQGDGWEPLYSPEDIDKVIGYRDLATGTIRTPEQHRAPIATPLSAFEPVVPTPQEIAAKAQTPAPRGAFADLAPVIDQLPQAMGAFNAELDARSAERERQDQEDTQLATLRLLRRMEEERATPVAEVAAPPAAVATARRVTEEPSVPPSQVIERAGQEFVAPNRIGESNTEFAPDLKEARSIAGLDATAMPRDQRLAVEEVWKQLRLVETGRNPLGEPLSDTDIADQRRVLGIALENARGKIGAPNRIPATNSDPLALAASKRGRREMEYYSGTADPEDLRPYTDLESVIDGGGDVSEIMAHGIAGMKPEEQLRSLITKGIDPKRRWNTGDLGSARDSTARAAGVGAKIEAPYVLISRPGKDMKRDGFDAVVVNGAARAGLDDLRQAFPQTEFLTPDQIPDWKAQVPEPATEGELDESRDIATQQTSGIAADQAPSRDLLRDAVAGVNAAGEELAPEDNGGQAPIEPQPEQTENAPQPPAGLSLSLGSPVELRRPGQEPVRGTLRDLSDAAATVDTPSGQVQVRRQFVAPVDRGLSTPLNPQSAKGQGTYVSRKVEPRSGDVISRWARARGVEGLVNPDEMHVTLAYSRKPFPAPVDGKPMRVSLNNPRIEKLGDKGALVLRFDSPELESRFQAMKQAGAEYDYPSFKPHITLSYKPGKTPTELNLKGLPKQVLFTGETAEPLDEDAGPSKPATETVAEQPDERQTDIEEAAATDEESGLTKILGSARKAKQAQRLARQIQMAQSDQEASSARDKLDQIIEGKEDQIEAFYKEARKKISTRPIRPQITRARSEGPRTREGIKFEGLGTDAAGAPVVGVRLDRAGRNAGLDQIAKELQTELRRIAGGKLNVRAYDMISMRRGDQNLAMGGYQLGSVIGVAVLDGDGKLRSEGDIKATGRHEAIHFMRETGLIPAPSWRVLEARAAKWRPAFGIDAKYEGLDPDALNEEAIAEAYAAWSNGELRTDAMVTPIMRRIKQVLAAIRDVVRRVLGLEKLPSVEEVFRAIEGGEYADRGDGTVDVNGVAVAGFRATMDPRGQITAYHGTPHEFDKFSMDKIGTGEGAQAYGHGLYFAENQDVAEGYRTAGQSALGSWGPELLLDGKNVDWSSFAEDSPESIGLQAFTDSSLGEGVAGKIAGLREAGDNDAADWLAANQGRLSLSRSSLYTVSLDVDPEDLLDWDKPLSEQSPKVRDALEKTPAYRAGTEMATKYGLSEKNPDGMRIYHYVMNGVRDWEQTATRVPGEDSAAASKALLDAGILGVKYLDADSRSEGDGTRNIVMFSDDRIAITAKAQVLGAGSTMQPTSVRDNMDELERISYPSLQAAFNRLGRTDAAGRIGRDLDRLRFLFQDRFLPVKRVEEAVERRIGRPLTEAERAYLQEELYSGRVGERKFRLDQDFKKPILENLAKAGLTVDQADEYIYAKHAQERNAHIAAINPKIPDGGSGMTDEEAKNILRNAARADPAKLAALERHSDLVSRMLNERLDTLEQSGLYAPEEIQAWRDQYQHYVPLRGKEADPDAELEDAIKPVVGRGFMGSRSREKPATGRFTRAPDILATAFTMADEAIVRAEKQRVQQAFLNLVQTANDPDFAVVNPVQRKGVLRQVPIFETRKIIETDRATGRKSYKEKRVKIGSRPQVRYTNLPRAEEKDTVYVRVAGKEYRIQVKNDEVLAALKAMGGSEMGAIMGAMAKVNGVLSQLNTMWNPEFVVNNTIMDAEAGFANLSKEKVAGIRRKVASYYVSAFRGAVRYVHTGKADTEMSRWAKEFREAGGATAFNQLTDAAQLRTTIEKELKQMSDFSRTGKATRFARNAFSWVGQINTGADNAMRLAVYRALREAGYSSARAASVAKNLTVNFTRKGALGPQLNAFLMFYNASVQGTATLVSAMKSPTVRKIAGGIAVAGLAQEVLLGMMPPPDDDKDKLGLTAYERIPEYIKSRNMIIPTGTGVGDYLSVRMPYGYNVFHNVGRLMAAYGRGARELDGRQVTLGQTMARMLTAFAEGMAPAGLSGTGALGPVPVPSVIEPVVETFTNRNYQDKPISPDRFPGDDKPDSQNYFNSVSPVSREAAQLLNQITGGTAYKAGLIDISPESMDHVFTSTIGAAGAFAWGAIQDTRRAVGEAIGANAEDPKLGVSDVPFVRKVVGNASPYQAKDATYRRIEEIETLQDELDGALQNKDRAAAKRIRAENGPLLSMVSQARKIQRDLSEIRKKRIATLDGKGTASAKRAATDRLEKREREMMARFNTQYLRAMKRAEAA